MKIRYTFLILAILLISVILVNGCVPEEPKPELTPEIQEPVKENISASEPIKEKTFQKGNEFEREFEWKYDDYIYTITLVFNERNYDLYKERIRKRDYDLFASDPYDDELIEFLAETFKDLGKESGLSKEQIPGLAIAFVQSLPYTSDDVTTGFDEYPRFPYETLYDNGGDCEDTAILTAAILQELDYGVILIKLPEHIAVGVKCDEKVAGYAYTYQGHRFCYLETTGKGWDVGDMPEEYQEQKAIIIPIYKRPFLDINFESQMSYSYSDVYTDINVTATNVGSEKAEGAIIYIALQTRNEDKVWDQIESDVMDIEPEEVINYNVINLHAPKEDFRIYVTARGENFVSDEAVSEWITWND